MDKSHVSMEQKACVVCGKPFDTGAILLDRRLRDSMERYTVTGWGMCPEHEALRKGEYVALVEVDMQKSEIANGIVRPSNAYRLGGVAHMKKEAFEHIFKKEAPLQMVVFCDTTTMNSVKEFYQLIEKGRKEKGGEQK